MSAAVLVLRPQPGAEETARRARALGLDAVVAPLFEIRPLAWRSPDPAGFDAIVVTSANAARHGGPALAAFAHLPCYAVGEATAAAAREAGLGGIRAGRADGDAVLRLMAADGIRRAFHPGGRERIALRHPDIRLVAAAVYGADPVERLPQRAEAALARGAIALLHSPRAAALFAKLAGGRGGIDIVAISEAAAEAAGPGWRSVAVAGQPRDEPLLELAVGLCQTGRR